MATHHRFPPIVLAVWLTAPGAAFAQDDVAGRGVRVDGDGQPYRPWDLTISTGLHSIRSSIRISA